MLGNLQPLGREIKDLASVLINYHRPRQAPATARTVLWPMLDNPIRLIRLPQRLTLMALLSARAPTALVTLALRPRPLLQPIARWRFTAVAAILGQLRLKRLDLSLQGLDLSPQLRNPHRLAAHQLIQLQNQNILLLRA